MEIKEVAELLGKTPREVRRAARSKFGKLPEKGRWDLTEKQVKELEEFFQSKGSSGRVTLEMESKSK